MNSIGTLIGRLEHAQWKSHRFFWRILDRAELNLEWHSPPYYKELKSLVHISEYEVFHIQIEIITQFCDNGKTSSPKCAHETRL